MKTEKEINDLVAIEIMGFVRSAHENLNFELMGWKTGENSWTSSFSPSKDISDAWQVVEKLLKDKLAFIDISMCSYSYKATISTPDGNYEAEAETAQLAICRAALEAKGIEII